MPLSERVLVARRQLLEKVANPNRLAVQIQASGLQPRSLKQVANQPLEALRFALRHADLLLALRLVQADFIHRERLQVAKYRRQTASSVRARHL